VKLSKYYGERNISANQAGRPRIFEEHLNIYSFNFTIRPSPRNGDSNTSSTAFELLEESITAYETSESDREVIDDL
jgi:hypothetical protein